MAQGRESLGDVAYVRHQPEQTLLYQLVEAHYPALVNQLAQQGRSLPDHVHREFEAYLKCGRLEHGFLRVRCDTCHFERLAWAARSIQRFGSALNLNIHFHILFLDGVYSYRNNRPPRFQRVRAPDKSELEDLVQLISQRAGRCLERLGLLEQDADDCMDAGGRAKQEPEPRAPGWNSIPQTILMPHPIMRGGPCPRYWAVPCLTGSLSAPSKAKRRS